MSLQASIGRQDMPALGFPSLEEPVTTIQISSFKGRPTVINLWTTWYLPCVRKMPVLPKAQADLPNVHFVFLNQGETADKVGT